MIKVFILILGIGTVACNQSNITAEDIENANRAGESVATWKAKGPIRDAQKAPVPGAPCSDERFRHLNRVDPDRFMEEFRACVNAEAARQAKVRR